MKKVSRGLVSSLLHNYMNWAFAPYVKHDMGCMTHPGILSCLTIYGSLTGPQAAEGQGACHRQVDCWLSVLKAFRSFGTEAVVSNRLVHPTLMSLECFRKPASFIIGSKRCFELRIWPGS